MHEHLRLMGEPEPYRKRYPRSCWRKMAMYTCPDPVTIVEGLFDLYAVFHDMDDPLNPGRKVLVSNALKILKTEMGYVQKGCSRTSRACQCTMRRASCRPVSKRSGVSAVRPALRECTCTPAHPFAEEYCSPTRDIG